MEDMKKLGRIGGKALIYFEAVTTLALIIGLVVVNTLQPGGGMHVDPASLDTAAIAIMLLRGMSAKSSCHITGMAKMSIC